ncbi:hypothetical protein O181_042261 [Austropuccinia psidii MF-1]|uniref:Gag-Pol-p199 n=1 Tax=Austropuccinia psidii MF-1 TaxID=1389203 RepID=A0A9Q3DEJ3_9BASI|nr:hypothetical protein [Austropuccinia psidii MF-1]
MIRQISTASPSFNHSTEIARINAASKFGRRDHNLNVALPTHNKNTSRFPIASSSRNQETSRIPSSRFPCHYCGEVGHWSPTCPVKAKANEAKIKAQHKKASVAGIGVVPTLEGGEALLDSGATHSVVGHLSLFTSITPTNMTLSVALSESFKVDAIGTIAISTSNGTICLNNVLYCRNIPGVILSLGHLITENFLVSFSNNLFKISTPSFQINTIKKNNQWIIPFSSSNDNNVSITCLSLNDPPVKSNGHSKDDTSMLWHRRIGHLSIRQLTRMLKSKAVLGIPNISFTDIKICHDCSLSKSQHSPVRTVSRRAINKPGDLTVADLMGPYESSLNHKKYILMIQDAFSRVVVAIALSDKTEAKTYFINWIKQFMNITTYKIKTVRTDNGTEFKNNVFNDFLIQNGIIHEYLMPYEHHQNGRIERTNRTISEMARTSLIAAKLPPFLWPWAFRHSVWIFNRSLHAESEKTPFEILGEKKPDLALLRVFGAKSFLYNHNFKKDFSPRATVGYHMGISEDSKGWLFWVPGRWEIFKSASVLLDELSFYRGSSYQNEVKSIQVRNIFDGSMVNELNQQDATVRNLANQSSSHLSIPTTYKEAIVSDNGANWIEAINEEIRSMKNEEVFSSILLKDALREVPRESILSTKWVFTKKPERFKARLVARGFRQINSINYDETFAPTPTFNSLRLLFSTACLKKWTVKTFDVKVAFLHSLIDKPVYVWPPMGLDVPKHNVLKLNKALYGTKQASSCWWLHLQNILQKIGFRNNDEDPSTYTLHQGDDHAILWIHVDDGALTASSTDLLDKITHQLSLSLKIKWDVKLNGLVGISIKETKEGFKFYQPDLIDKLTNLSPSKITAKTPLPPNCQLDSNFSVGIMDKPYLKRISILLYIAQACRPDISFAPIYVGILIRKLNTSSEIKCFVDANWGGKGNRSTHGYIILHGINPIGWQSKRQTTVASSTAQSEYMALSFVAKETLWLYNLFYNVLQNATPTLFSDNRTAVGISNESMNRKQTRHLIREFNTINEFITAHKLKLEWVSTTDQLADIMTKPLGYMKNTSFMLKLNAP